MARAWIRLPSPITSPSGSTARRARRWQSHNRPTSTLPTSLRAFWAIRQASPIHYVTPAQVAAWRDAAAKKASPQTANKKLKIIRVLFRSAWRDGLLTENPASKVPGLKAGETNRRAFSLAELKAVLRVAGLEWKGLILAGLYTGQRLKDITSLTWANVDIERDEFRLTTSKTGRSQIIPIAKPLRVYLGELPAGDNPTALLFPSAYRIATENVHMAMLSRQFHELLVSAGVAKAGAKTHKATGKGRHATRQRNELSFHSLRHTATSMLKASGAAEAVTRDIIGHESAEISRHYTHVDEDAKRSAIDRLPNIS
jgi:integrase